MRRFYFILLSLSLIALACFPQSGARQSEAVADSLLSAFEKSPGIAVANRFFDLLHSEELTEEHIRFTTSVHPDTLRQQVFYWAAEYYYDRQQYDRAVAYGQRSLPLCRASGNSQGEADCLSVLSIACLRMGDTQRAADYARQCYELDLKGGDPDNISSSLNTLAGIYLGANLPDKAEGYVLKGIDYCKKAGNDSRLATLNGMASEVYHALGDQQRALDYATTAYQIEQQLKRPDRAAIRLSQMAAALTGLHRFNEAKDCLKRAIPQLEADGNLQSLGICYNKMGEVLKWEKNYDEAAKYFARGAEIFQKLRDPYNELHSQLGLYNSLKEQNPQEAMQHLERYNQLKDTIYSREAAQSMGRTEAQLGKAQLEAERAAANERARQHARYLYIGIVIACVLALVVVVLVIMLRRRTRQFARQFNELTTDLNQLNEQYEQLRKLRDADKQIINQDADAKEQANNADSRFMKQVDDIVKRQIENGHVDVASLAQELCMSLTAFRRRFSALVDVTPQAYVTRLRMEEAQRLLDTHPELNIAEVGMRLGFDDKSNFTRTFKRVLGITPSEYIKERT